MLHTKPHPIHESHSVRCLVHSKVVQTTNYIHVPTAAVRCMIMTAQVHVHIHLAYSISTALYTYRALYLLDRHHTVGLAPSREKVPLGQGGVCGSASGLSSCDQPDRHHRPHQAPCLEKEERNGFINKPLLVCNFNKLASYPAFFRWNGWV